METSEGKPLIRDRTQGRLLRILSIIILASLAYLGILHAEKNGWWFAEAGGPLPTEAVPVSQALVKLIPLHQKLGKPRPGDWLTQHDESGQTFAEYLTQSPTTPTAERDTLYIQPLGDLNESQRRIIYLTAEYLGICYGLPVEVLDPIPLNSIPSKARRVHPQWGDKQILSTYVLNEVLSPKLPKDAAALLCLTTSDLWPGKDWNFVFGQASLAGRVGVWSIHRFGDPEQDFRSCLRRTLKTAAHETGHMFSILHCTAYECCMCGSNNLGESDRRPLWFCPECVSKIHWANRVDAPRRFLALEEFCEENGLRPERRFFAASLEAVSP